jgi:NTP pyrophosphatase (non-canonical NTP hydrolase)
MSFPVILPNAHIYEAISDERARQERLKAEGKFEFTCADVKMSLLAGYAVLGEEVGEVGREILAMAGLVREAPDRAKLQKELVQVAAVTVALLERLEKEDP